MNRENVFEKVCEIIKETFDNDSIVITDDTVASDVEGWDSLNHITLLGTIEDEFSIKFAMKDVVSLKNVGQLVDLVLEQVE